MKSYFCELKVTIKVHIVGPKNKVKMDLRQRDYQRMSPRQSSLDMKYDLKCDYMDT